MLEKAGIVSAFAGVVVQLGVSQLRVHCDNRYQWEMSDMKFFDSATVKSRSAAFTLVELLVVISIIALLIALLLPALASARAEALSVACASNERSMGQAMEQYVGTWNGFYPGNEVVGGKNAGASNFCVWVPRLMTVMGPGSAHLFYCPARSLSMQYLGYMYSVTAGMPPPGYGRGYVLAGFGYKEGQEVLYLGNSWQATSGPQTSLPAFSYGYNDWGTLGLAPPAGDSSGGKGLGGDMIAGTGNGGYPQVRITAVVNPSQMIAITDRIDDATHGDPNYPFIYNSDPTRSNVALPISSIPGVVQWAEWPGAIHNNGSNVVWADGHVSYETQKNLVQVNPAQGGSQMNMNWNNDHQIHAPLTGYY